LFGLLEMEASSAEVHPIAAFLAQLFVQWRYVKCADEWIARVR